MRLIGLPLSDPPATLFVSGPFSTPKEPRRPREFTISATEHPTVGPVAPTHGLHRHFVGWDGPALPRAARLLVSRHGPDPAEAADPIHPPPSNEGSGAGRDVLDLSEVFVVLPGARAGRRLLELLLEPCEAEGWSLRPPRVATLGGLPELLFPPARPEPSPLLLRRLWARELGRLPREQLEGLLVEPPAPDDLPGWMELARTVVELQSTVGAEGHSFADVGRICAGGLLFNDEDRWTLLARAQRRVRAALQELGREDREARRTRMLEGSEAPSGPTGELWLVGVTQMPGVARRLLLRRLEAASHPALEFHCVVHAPEDRAADFDALGCVRPEAWTGTSAGIPREAIRVVGGPREQADAVMKELRRLRRDRTRGWAPEEVTLGAADPEIAPFLSERLREEGVRTRIAAGTPLERSLPARLLLAVAAYLGEGRWDALATLLRHPVLAPGLSQVLRTHESSAVERLGRSPSALADAYHAIHLPTRIRRPRAPDPGRTWLPSGGEPRGGWLAEALSGLVDHLHDQILGDLAGDPRPLSAWGAPIRDLLLAAYGDSRELDPHERRDREVVEVARTVSEVAEELAGLPAELDDEVGGEVALGLVAQEVRTRAAPPLSDDEAVELLGWLELHLDDAPVLLVTGVNDPHLPSAITSDPFLPHSLRARLGLLDNDGRWARDLYQLQAILHSRPETRLIAGRRTLSGDPLRPSRLLLAEEGEELAWRVRAFLGDEDEGVEVGASAPVPQADPAPEPSRDDPFRLPPEPLIRASEPLEGLAVTRFRAILEDPYRFALESLLGLERVDDAAREMDALAFGGLGHTVLERFGRGCVETSGGRASSDPRELQDRLDHLLDGEARSRFGPRPNPAVRIQVEQLRGRLHAFAQWQAEWAAEGWEIAGVEVRPEAPDESPAGVAFPVDGLPFFLRGRIDRVDRHPDRGRWLLLDYKTSRRARTPEEAHRKKSGRRKADPMEWVDLQLPLYRHLIRGVVHEGAPLVPLPSDEVELGYINLPSELGDTGIALATEWSRTDLLEADELARDVVRFLRENRFEWEPEMTRIGPDHDLAPVVGLGAFRPLDEDDEEDEDER